MHFFHRKAVQFLISSVQGGDRLTELDVSSKNKFGVFDPWFICRLNKSIFFNSLSFRDGGSKPDSSSVDGVRLPNINQL